MALFGLLGSDKPTEKNIAKQVTKIRERYAQPEYRRAAMDQLLEWGTPEALDGVLSRFGVVVQSPHWDEEEKRWLVEEFADLGEPGVEALCRFLARDNNVTFAAKALRRLVDQERFKEEIIKALKARDPEDHRTVQAKQDLIALLGELDSDDLGDVVLPYLDDHADDVQCAAIDVVESQGGEAARARLIEMITEDLHSARVLRHAAGAVSRLKLSIDPEKPLAPAVTEDYVVKDGTLALNR